MLKNRDNSLLSRFFFVTLQPNNTKSIENEKVFMDFLRYVRWDDSIR